MPIKNIKTQTRTPKIGSRLRKNPSTKEKPKIFSSYINSRKASQTFD